MRFIDISQDTKNNYRLEKNEKVVFFLLNRDGKLDFEMAGENAEAHIFAFAIGHGETKQKLEINQKHLAPRTTSSALVKAALKDEAEFSYEGLIHIGKKALLSDASQESRSLLLSPLAKASTKPALEILADDVACSHKATVSPVSKEALFFVESRGLSRKQATELLVSGFMKSSFDEMKELTSSINNKRIKNLESRITEEIQSVLSSVHA